MMTFHKRINKYYARHISFSKKLLQLKIDRQETANMIVRILFKNRIKKKKRIFDFSSYNLIRHNKNIIDFFGYIL